MTKKQQKEQSAGGILVSKQKGVWFVLLIRDSKGMWTFPKGKIETGEDPQIAARREVSEEVAISDLSYKAALTPIHYWYTRGGAIYKTVTYFVFETPKRFVPSPQKEEGITAAKWVRLSQAMRIVGYPDTHKHLLTNVRKLLVRI